MRHTFGKLTAAFACALLVITLTAATTPAAPAAGEKVLLFTKTTSFRHDSIPAGVAMSGSWPPTTAGSSRTPRTRRSSPSRCRMPCCRTARSCIAQSDGTLRTPGGKCLDAGGGSSAGGTQLIIWSCHGGANQRWTLS